MTRTLRPAADMPRIYLYREPVDFCMGFRGLGALVEQELAHNPFDGGLYAFTNRQRNKIKCLYWEENGFGPPDRPVVVFEYDASRSAEVPSRLLEGFRGTLQTDGYAGYNQVCKDNHIVRIGCWDHARRKFVDAIEGMPTKQKRSGRVSKADVALSKIRKLYKIEDNIKTLSPEQRYEKKQQQSLPILKDLKVWLEKNISKLPKDSLTYTAMYYTLNQWDTLVRYCDNGYLRISNVLAENAIRPLAIGRRNWLFSDTPKGAQGSATCYSLIETAKANGLEPYDYLHHVLQHIAAADTVEKLEALLPWNVKKVTAPR